MYHVETAREKNIQLNETVDRVSQCTVDNKEAEESLN